MFTLQTRHHTRNNNSNFIIYFIYDVPICRNSSTNNFDFCLWVVLVFLMVHEPWWASHDPSPASFISQQVTSKWGNPATLRRIVWRSEQEGSKSEVKKVVVSLWKWQVSEVPFTSQHKTVQDQRKHAVARDSRWIKKPAGHGRFQVSEHILVAVWKEMKFIYKTFQHAYTSVVVFKTISFHIY